MARPLKEDLTGKRFGKLTVIRRNGTTPSGNQPLWWCRCDCGVEKNVQGNAMRRGYSSSCGCWRREFSVVTKTTHGRASKDPRRRSKIYGVWAGMKNRCHNPNQPHYQRYGGRGIKVCDEWRTSFEAFYRDMGEPPKDGQRWTLDRIDVNGNYEPGNVRWATYTQQNQPENKRPLLDAEKVRQVILSLAEDAHEAAKAKDAYDYVAGWQDAIVECDEAIRELIKGGKKSS
jgi:hypothetical protein